jgi:hypothetical protein
LGPWFGRLTLRSAGGDGAARQPYQLTVTLSFLPKRFW